MIDVSNAKWKVDKLNTLIYFTFKYVLEFVITWITEDFSLPMSTHKNRNGNSKSHIDPYTMVPFQSLIYPGQKLIDIKNLFFQEWPGQNIKHHAIHIQQ